MAFKVGVFLVLFEVNNITYSVKVFTEPELYVLKV